VIFTNEPGLYVVLSREAPELAAKVHVLFQFDVLRELYALLDPDNGQRDRVVAALSESPYGRATWPCALLDRPSFAGALFVLRRDYRFDEVYPEDFRRQISSKIEEFEDVTVLVGHPPPAGGYRVPEPAEPWMRRGCAASSKAASTSTSRPTPAAESPRTGR
jgi:hypothetical protein